MKRLDAILDQLRGQALPPEEELAEREAADRAEHATRRGAVYAEALARSVPAQWRDMLAAPYEPDVSNRAARQAASGLDLGRSLFLYGPPGVGKTHLALRVADSLTRKHGVKAHAWAWPELVARLRDWRNTDRAPSIAEPPVLVIDDFDKGAVTEFVYERAYDVLQRLFRKHTTIVTANRSPAEVAIRFGLGDEQNTAALVSRFGLFEACSIAGRDRRR